jgi:Uma2 family endonuclease
MSTAPSDRLMTADELLHLPDDGRFYELVRGKLIEVSPSSSESSWVSADVLTRINTFVRQHGLGRCGDSDWGFLLATNPDTVRAPDVGFVRAERIPASGVPPGYWPGAPDLAVEVLSPSNRPTDVLRKVAEYLDAGASLVWVLDPQRRRATVYHPDGTVTVLGEDGVLDGEDLLPGFTLPLAEVWV